MRSAPFRVAVLAAPAAALLACTSSGSTPSPTQTATHTVVTTTTRTPSTGPTAPVSTGPTTAGAAPACPLVATAPAAGRVGMRLARITVLRSGGAVVGCRLYALQNSPLHESEHLPGPHQPAIEIDIVKYASPGAAHNAFVLEARRGANPQQTRIGKSIGVCFQIPFYPRDKGRDWACAFSVGVRVVIVRTVVTSPALNVAEVSRTVAGRL